MLFQKNSKNENNSKIVYLQIFFYLLIIYIYIYTHVDTCVDSSFVIVYMCGSWWVFRLYIRFKIYVFLTIIDSFRWWKFLLFTYYYYGWSRSIWLPTVDGTFQSFLYTYLYMHIHLNYSNNINKNKSLVWLKTWIFSNCNEMNWWICVKSRRETMELCETLKILH